MAGTPPWTSPDRPEGDDGTPIPDEVEIAIIGGGLTGLATARTLAISGASVAVFEAERVGSGATGASLGVLSVDYPGGPNALLQRVGGGITTALWLAAQEAMTLVAGIASMEPAVVRTVAPRRRDHETLRRDVRWLTDRGFAVRIGDDLSLRAVIDDTACVVNPLELADAFRRDVIEAGGIICEDVATLSVSRHTGSYQVLSAAGKTSADVVIVATNGAARHAGVPDPGQTLRETDAYGFTTVDDGAVTTAMAGADVLRSVAGLMVRRTAQGRVLVGGQRGLASGLDPTAAAVVLRTMAARLIDGIGDVPIESAWSAPIGLTGDRMPHIWRVDGMWFGGGYNGDALVPAIAVGTQLAEMLAGARSQTVFSDIAAPVRRLRPSPGRVAARLDRWLRA